MSQVQSRNHQLSTRGQAQTEVKPQQIYLRGMIIFRKSNVRTFFILDITTGVVHLFKNTNQTKPSRSISASGGTFPTDNRIITNPTTGQIVPSFEFQLRKMKGRPIMQFTVLSEASTEIEVLRAAFEKAILLPPPKTHYAQTFGKGMLTVAKVPWKITSVVVVTLEKIGEGARATPDFLTGTRAKKNGRIKRPVPSNMVTGVAIGTKLMVESIVSAVAGVVLEPVRGARRGGVRGGALGFGKGVLGLVCKPVAGTIDLVTHTTRGIGNTPKTMYVGLSKLIRKRRRYKKRPKNLHYPPIRPYIPPEFELNANQKYLKRKHQYKNPNEDSQSSDVDPNSEYDDEDQSDFNSEDEIYLGEEDGEEYFINRKALQDHIKRTEIGLALKTGEEMFESMQEREMMYEIIATQKILLKNRELQIQEVINATTNINQFSQELFDRLNCISNYEESFIQRPDFFDNEEMNTPGAIGYREIEMVGFPTPANEEDQEMGMQEMINNIKSNQGKRLRKRRRRHHKDEDFGDIEEFDEEEEENYIQNILEKKKLEDENLEVYLIEAEEVREADDEAEDTINKEIGDSSDEDYQEEEKSVPHHLSPGKSSHRLEYKIQEQHFRSPQKEVSPGRHFDPLEPFIRCYKLRSTIKKEVKNQFPEGTQYVVPFLTSPDQRTERIGDDEEIVIVRNSKNRLPPAIHSHHMRNAFLRDFNPESILSLEKTLQKEIFDERAHYNMIIKKKPKEIMMNEEEENDPEIRKQHQEQQRKEREEKRKHDEERKKQHDEEERKKNDPKLKLKLRILENAKKFKKNSRSDDYRVPDAFKDGGFGLTDQVILNKYRQAGKEIIKQVGRSILSGHFNLTNISFPIKCMQHQSILQIVGSVAMIHPIYLNAAALTNDPLERMKLVITDSVAFVYPTHHFDKPLNPILGETFQGELPDGSMVYCEQSFHKPPISHVLVCGPDDLYQWSGYSHFSAKAGLNSVSLNVVGGKTYKFKDGTVIKHNNQGDQFNNTFFGTLNHQVTGKIEFTDEKNGITAFYQIGSERRKAQDYFAGEIRVKGVKVCDIKGNYMGYIDFNGERYWDLRDQVSYDVIPANMKESLLSDSRFRIDSKALLEGDVEVAQKNKETLEVLQRHDRKLREEAEERRNKGGAKYKKKNKMFTNQKTLKIEPKKGIINVFELGDSANKVLTNIQINIQVFGKIEIINSKQDAKQALFLILPESGITKISTLYNHHIGIKLKFDPKYQKLELIELYFNSEGIKKKLPYILRDQFLSSVKPTYNAINHLMGPTFPPKLIGASVLLCYDGISFGFQYPEQLEHTLTQDSLLNYDNILAKINILYQPEQVDNFSSNEYISNSVYWKVKMHLNEGIEVYQPDNLTKESIIVCFGDHLMDVMKQLGNPNKEYHKDESLFLNYLELGVDIMINKDFQVQKFILHTNFPTHPFFGFHNRCVYELLVDMEAVKEEKKDYVPKQPCASSLSQKQKKRNRKKLQQLENNSKDSSGNSSKFVESKFVITPQVKFTQINAVLEPYAEEKQKLFYVRNYTNGFTTHYYAFKSVIFEVMPDSDYVASVTLFKTA